MKLKLNVYTPSHYHWDYLLLSMRNVVVLLPSLLLVGEVVLHTGNIEPEARRSYFVNHKFPSDMFNLFDPNGYAQKKLRY